MSAAFVASRKVRHILAAGLGDHPWIVWRPICGRRNPMVAPPRGWPLWANYPGNDDSTEAYDREWARAVRLSWCTRCTAALAAMTAMVEQYPDGGA